MAAVRDAIVNDAYPQFIRNFMRNMYGGESEAGVAAAYPQWAVDALQAVGVDLMVDAWILYKPMMWYGELIRTLFDASFYIIIFFIL